MSEDNEYGLLVYGHSDDLIEVSGDVDEEFYANYDKPTILVFSTGLVVGIEYDDTGTWKITVHARPDDAEYVIHPATAGINTTADYTDALTMDDASDVEWVVKGSEFHRTDE